jgi:hypothetical protein
MATKRISKAREQKAATKGKTAPTDEAEADNDKTTKPKQFKKAAQDEIGKTYKQIVRALANEAVGGSVQHTKLLFDLGGVKEEVRAVSTRRRKSPSLGKLLLDEAAALKRGKEQQRKGDEAK